MSEVPLYGAWALNAICSAAQCGSGMSGCVLRPTSAAEFRIAHSKPVAACPVDRRCSVQSTGKMRSDCI